MALLPPGSSSDAPEPAEGQLWVHAQPARGPVGRGGRLVPGAATHACGRHACMQIARRRKAHQEKNPDAKIISLGIGDTTEPLPKYIADAMAKAAAGLATREGYSGCVPAPAQRHRPCLGAACAPCHLRGGGEGARSAARCICVSLCSPLARAAGCAATCCAVVWCVGRAESGLQHDAAGCALHVQRAMHSQEALLTHACTHAPMHAWAACSPWARHPHSRSPALERTCPRMGVHVGVRPLCCSYGAEQGQGTLREAMAETFYKGLRTADEVFISDGSKCDIARIQMMFGSRATVAVQVRAWRRPYGAAALAAVEGGSRAAAGCAVRCGTGHLAKSATAPVSAAAGSRTVRTRRHATCLLAADARAGCVCVCVCARRCASQLCPILHVCVRACRRTRPTRRTWTPAS